VELFEGGQNVQVTASNLKTFCDMVLDYRLNLEAKEAIDALCDGFHEIVPVGAVAMVKWFELEQMVCGQPDFNVDALLSTARFEGLSAEDPRVTYLRDTLTGFTRHERALFLRFISGRERLPANLRLKIMSSASNSAGDTACDDEHLPHASTCFYWLSLPKYSSKDVLREKLLFAISQCVDIDADFRVRDQDDEVQPNVVMGAEGDDEEDFEDYRHLL
jgi:hypothetical protein